MKAIKILVIEDMVNTIKGAFDLAALAVYNDSMTFEFVTCSQDIKYDSISDYGLIFVDIELAKGSKEDGYSVLNKIINNYNFPPERTIILTGNTVVEEKLIENDIDPKIHVVKKPINYLDIIDQLKKKIRLEQDGTYTIL